MSKLIGPSGIGAAQNTRRRVGPRISNGIRPARGRQHAFSDLHHRYEEEVAPNKIERTF